MAARFWVGGTGTWDASSTTNWSASSGGASGASAPTSSDDVTFDTLSNATAYTVTLTGTPACLSLTMGAPLAGKVTMAGSGTLSLYGNANFSGGTAGITRTYTGQITWATLVTATFTFTSNGVTFASTLLFPGSGASGTFRFLDAFSTTGDITQQAGATGRTIDTNGQSITVGRFQPSGSSVTMGASTITVTGNVVDFSAGGTVTCGTSTITCNAAVTFSGGAQTFNIVTMPGSSTINQANTFATLTITGSASTNLFSIGGNQTISGTLTLNGNSSTNRLQVASTVLGTSRTLTAATVSVSNADFMDITGAGAGSWDLTGATGSPINFGNCSGITFNTTIVASGIIGQQSIGASTDNGNLNLATAIPWYSDSVGGTVLLLKACVWSTSGTSSIKMAVYSNNAGAPGTLIASSGAIVVTRTTKPTLDSQFVSATINSGTISANTWYWLVFDTNNNDVQNAYVTNSIPLPYNGSSTYSSFPPAPWSGSLALYSRAPTIYATYGTAPVTSKGFFQFM